VLILSDIKVAHITTVDISLRYLLLNQMRSLQQASYIVKGISSPGPWVSEIEAGGIQHLAIPFVRSSRLTPWNDVIAFWHLYRLLRREKFTIVHTHTAKPDLYGQLAARLARTPIVLSTLHGFYFHEHMPKKWRRFFILLAKIGAHFSDVILSQNSEDMQTAQIEKICPPSKMKQLGNGIDVQRFDRARLDPQILQSKRRELNIPDDVPVVGFVGRLVKDKGILELLRAAQIIHRQLPDVRFLFIGLIDRHKLDVITPEIAKDYGLEHVCIFAGMREDMPEMYALMDVFVLPSHREAFPRAPMEASAMSVPCVATNVRGCRETVEEGRNGLLVPLGEVQPLAEAILSLLNDRNRARQMGIEGRRIALERFDEQLVFARVKAEYARLLEEKDL
jgi:glycosyltransferase involved in cell wall biosynthesis